jgi:hypothetical protein
MTGQAASCTILPDQLERVLGALAEPDERDVRSLPPCHLTNLLHLELACDDLVPERLDETRHELEPLRPLVGDQDAEMLELVGEVLPFAVSHGAAPVEEGSSTG